MKSTDKNTCDCGGKYLGKNKKQHNLTKKHKLYDLLDKIEDKEITEKLKEIQKKKQN